MDSFAKPKAYKNISSSECKPATKKQQPKQMEWAYDPATRTLLITKTKGKDS